MQQISLQDRTHRTPVLLFSPLTVGLLCACVLSGNPLVWGGSFIIIRSTGPAQSIVAAVILSLFACMYQEQIANLPPIVIPLMAMLYLSMFFFNRLHEKAAAACLSSDLDRFTELLRTGTLRRIPGERGRFWADCQHALRHAMEGDMEIAEHLMSAWRGKTELETDSFLLMMRLAAADLDGAAQVLDRLISSNADYIWCRNPQTLIELSMIYIELGRWRKAIYLLDNAKPSETPSLDLVYAFLDKREHFDIFEQHKAKLPPAEELYYAAVSKQAEGRKAETIALLMQALELLSTGNKASNSPGCVRVTLLEKRIRRRLEYLNSTSGNSCEIWPKPDADAQWISRQLTEVQKHWHSHKWSRAATFNLVPTK